MIKEQCWACTQSKCNRCVGCSCDHEKEQWVKPEKSNQDNMADTMGKLLTMKKAKQEEKLNDS